MRKIVQFQTNEYYHVYNRGFDKREIFFNDFDYTRFLKSLREFNSVEPIGSLVLKDRRGPTPTEGVGPLVEIVCYCLNPNHYHLLLKQLVDGGISEFMKRIGGGYTSYVNLKHSRSGILFQGRFKAIHIKTDSYLQYLSCYINGNPEIHKIANAAEWQWSSYKDYFGLRNGTLFNKEIILKEFSSIDEYRKLVDYVIKDSSDRKEEVKKYLLE